MRKIGREKEYSKLQAIYNSGKPELVVVKGRRRIGKTYLVNNAFGNKFAFKHNGMSPVDLTENTGSIITQQLDSFCLSLKRYGYRNPQIGWMLSFCWNNCLNPKTTEKDKSSLSKSRQKTPTSASGGMNASSFL